MNGWILEWDARASGAFLAVLLSASAPLAAPTLAGEAGVEILRDRWGVPHVFAASEEAGFFGLGHACAEDRRLQMELLRRKGAGRLAEVFGPEWVRSDREARLAGHAAYAGEALAKLPAEMQAWLRAYAAGVNAWSRANPDAVERRFRPLGVGPEPWTPADCLLAARAVLSLGSPFDEEPVTQYHRFREWAAQVGESEAEKQFQMAVEDAAAIVPEAEMAKDVAAYRRLKARPRMPGFRLQGAAGPRPKMSHAWAVGGARSRTGKPLLESDPQLPLTSPPFFHEVHLSAGRIVARGAGIPGCPGLFIGFNRRIAWGASALGAASQVVFLDKLTEDGRGYWFRGKAEPCQRRLERIRVKGAADVVQEVLATRHGVVFNSLSRSARPGDAHVLHDPQTGDRGASARAMLALWTAGNWAEFCAAMEHYYDPGLHVVYADTDNNLGYHTLVHRPLTVRSPRLAQEGWTGRQEIAGRIPLDELPHMLNPAQGFISHANNMPVGTWYPHDLGLGTGGNGHTGRSWRLQQLLSGTQRYSVEDFEAQVHRDAVNPLVAALLPIARKVAEEDRIADPAVVRLLDAVRDWDLRATSVDRFPAGSALQNVLTPYRGSGLNVTYGAGMGGVTNLARRLGAEFDRGGATPRGPRERAYLVRWLRASAAGGGGRAAADDWTARLARGTPSPAGRTITIPYQKTTPVNLPTVDPALDIVSPPLACLDTGTIWSQPGNVYTQIVDLADLDNSRAMIAPGNCEDAASPLRTAGIELWVQGRTRPAPLSRAKVEQLGITRTSLAVQPYEGPAASPPLSVDKADPAWQLVPAIAPEAGEAPEPARARPADAQRPADPQLEAAFRIILRKDTAPGDIDRQLAACRKYVAGKPALVGQLRGAAVLGLYLIEESTAGRLKVPYGSPHALKRLRELLKELGGDKAGFLIAFAGIAAGAPAAEPRVFHARDFGAVPDGKTEAGGAIRAAIHAATAAGTSKSRVEVVLDAGTYRVRNEDRRHGCCFPVQEATNLVIRGAGKSTKILVADPKLGGFVFGLCRQVTLGDLVIDYDPLPFCQGTVRAVDVAAGHFDLEIEAGYPTPDGENFLKAQEPYGKWGMILDRATRRIRAGTPDHYMTPRWEHREGRVWRFFTAAEHYRRGLARMQVGDAYVHLARGFGSAVLAQGCDGVRLENVTVHAAPGLAVGLVANRGEILVRALEVRFPAGGNRLLSTNADGVHCQQNRSGPVIERCYFEGMADDAINIYAPPNVLREVRSATQWLVSPGCIVLPGDRLQVLDPKTGRLRGEVRAAAVQVEGRAFLLTLDKPLAGAAPGEDHRSGDTLYNLDACGAGFQIRGNHMHGNRRYGCLLRAGGGLVEDNTFEDTTGAGVVLTNEPDWPEGPVPWGITLRGNRFLRGGTCLGYADSPQGAALAVRTVRLGHGLAQSEGIRDIVIEENEFRDRGGTSLFVGGATSVTVRGNRVRASLDAERLHRGPAVLVEQSSRVLLADNAVVDPRPGTTAAVEVAASVARGEQGIRIAGLEARLHADSPALLDHRKAPPAR